MNRDGRVYRDAQCKTGNVQFIQNRAMHNARNRHDPGLGFYLHGSLSAQQLFGFLRGYVHLQTPVYILEVELLCKYIALRMVVRTSWEW